MRFTVNKSLIWDYEFTFVGNGPVPGAGDRQCR